MEAIAINTLQYDQSLCVGCGMCAAVCPHGVFEMNGRTALLVRYEACMECGACALNCPVGAITVDSGVGCAAAMIHAALTGGEVSCGGDGGAACCGAAVESNCCDEPRAASASACCESERAAATSDCCAAIGRGAGGPCSGRRSWRTSAGTRRGTAGTASGFRSADRRLGLSAGERCARENVRWPSQFPVFRPHG